MKPHRMRMTHNLLLNYGLYRKMEVREYSSQFFFFFIFSPIPLVELVSFVYLIFLCQVYRPHKATQDEMTKFHSDDYIRFLR